MTVYVWGDAGQYDFDLWPYAAAALIAAAAVLAWRTRHPSYVVCWLVFGVYLLNVMNLTLFPTRIDHCIAEWWSWGRLWENINIVPMYFGPYGGFRTALTGLALNVLMTVPFGFGLSFVVNGLRARHFLVLGPLVGLTIEGTQLMLCILLRFNYRTIDINDVMMNTLGVWLGYAGFLMFAWVWRWLDNRLGLPRWGMLGYITGVAQKTVG
ncbi:MAG: VanZ family protein [Anaerolineae bacterium]|jgi:glycopeptide antibiotics resistance protein|nr:VanZ family protein [Anaerolineae bacterium]